MIWSPDEMEKLERAIVEGLRIQIARRGTEFIVTPRSIYSDEGGDVVVGTTSVGDELAFPLHEIASFEVLW